MVKNSVTTTFKNDSAIVNLADEINSYTKDEFLFQFNQLQSDPNLNTITIKLNSVGGSIIDGYSIFSTIYNSTKETVAVIDGIAASMASVIMLGANKIKATDYSIIMMHNPFNSSIQEDEMDEKERQILEKFKDSLVTIYNKRTGIHKNRIKKLMNEETWLSAQEAKDMGLIDEIIVTEKLDKKNSLELSNIINSLNKKDFSQINSIYNKLFFEIDTNNTDDNEPSMKELKEILNKLNIEVEEGKEINSDMIVNHVNALSTDLKNKDKQLNEMKIKNEGLTTDIENKTSLITDLQNKVNDFEKKEEERIANEIESVIENAIKERKIKSSSKDHWKKLAEKDLEAVKNVLETVTKSVKFSDEIEDEVEEEIKVTKSPIQQELDKVKNKIKIDKR